MLSKLLKGLVGLAVVLFGISFLLPKDMNMTITQDLDASPEQVFHQVNNVENWKNWSPWFEMDPDMEITYGEIKAGAGAFYSWASEKKFVGEGQMIIDESIVNEKIGTVLKFEGEPDGFADMNLTALEEGGTNISWNFSSEYSAKMPWERFQVAMGRMMLKSSYYKGLDAIDSYIAENPDEHTEALNASTGLLNIERDVLEDFNAVTVMIDGTIADMQANGHDIFANAFGEAVAQIEAEGLTMTGAPFAIAYKWDEEEGLYEMELGVPVKEGGKAFEGSNAVRADYYGPYEGSGHAHAMIAGWLEAEGIEATGPPIEVYVTDPSTVPDPQDWLTEVYYPIP